jgi:hypothetical protein
LGRFQEIEQSRFHQRTLEILSFLAIPADGAKRQFQLYYQETNMSEPTPVTATSKGTAIIVRFLGKVAWPMVLFSMVLTMSLFLSRMLILPKLTQVSVAGGLHNATELRDLEVTLTAQLTEAEDRREALIRPLADAQYDAAKNARFVAPHVSNLRADINQLARSFDEAEQQIVVLSMIHIDAASRIVTIEGDVRNVGPQSMTVLAAFREELSQLSDVAELFPSAFARIDDTEIGPHSPFTLTLTLHP